MRVIFAAPVTDGEFDAFASVNVPPLVAYLATEDCPHTGKVFAALDPGTRDLARDAHTEIDGPWSIKDIADRTTDWR